MRQMVEGYKSQFAKVLPKHLSAERFVRVALTSITRTPKLADCDQASFFQALLRLSELGIEPDGRRAHLIPFENRKRGCIECQLIIDYKGLVELAMRSGDLSNLHADTVCENDEFVYDRGQVVRHFINFKKPRGNVYAVYAIARFKDGGEKAEVMGREDIEAIRSRSRAGQSGPWVTDWNEMAKKTVFRRLAKWLPLSPEFRDAAEADDEDQPPINLPTSSVIFEARGPMPVAESPNIVQFDDKAEADSGLAPVQAGPVAAQVLKEIAQPLANVVPASAVESPNQAAVMKLIQEAGYTLDELLRWGNETGNIPDASSIASFDQIPGGVCQRLLRAKAGLLAGLALVKGQAGGAA